MKNTTIQAKNIKPGDSIHVYGERIIVTKITPTESSVLVDGYDFLGKISDLELPNELKVAAKIGHFSIA